MGKKALFIFRRDLRLHDNKTLISALKENDEVIPVFIFTKKQLYENDYKSENALQFLISTLKELDLELRKLGSKLYIYYAENLNQKISEILDYGFTSLYFNIDYTPYSKKRDNEIIELARKKNISIYPSEDILINPINSILKDDGSFYSIFTPYYKKAIEKEIELPKENKFSNYARGNFSEISNYEEFFSKILPNKNPNLALKGGRVEAISILENLSNLKDYSKNRDYPSLLSTTKLSAHLKFGTISTREVIFFAKENMEDSASFIRQLYWRDFFTQIAYFNPRVFGEEFNLKFKNFKWEYDKEKFQAWANGRTGFPIIDAGMRELNTTGYMHNRVRMIVASFLTKDLRIDWRLGEKYFASKLIDYDPCVNNGSWQWAASTGCDAQPYFRIFNPRRQQERFDPDCIYIKKWVLELSNLSPSLIHKLEETRPLQIIDKYPKPIVNHSKESRETIEMFKNLN